MQPSATAPEGRTQLVQVPLRGGYYSPRNSIEAPQALSVAPAIACP